MMSPSQELIDVKQRAREKKKSLVYLVNRYGLSHCAGCLGTDKKSFAFPRYADGIALCQRKQQTDLEQVTELLDIQN